MINTKALIITGGDVDFSFKIFDSYRLIIAVDGGLTAAKKMKLQPDVIIGDFDTVSDELLKKYELGDIKSSVGKLHRNMPQIIRLNTQKDDTDTQAAVSYAIEQGITKIDMIGATGSRFDHTYANMFLLKMCHDKGVEMTFYTGLSKIYLISGHKMYNKEDFYGKYISFLPFDGCALGVTLKGFKYQLDNFDLDTRKNYRLPVSNEAGEGDAYVHIREGYLLVVESLEDKG